MATSAPSDAANPGASAARWSLFLGMLAPLLAACGLYFATERLATPFVAFRTFALALPVGLLGLISGWIGLLRARGGRNPGAKRAALAGSTLSTIVVAAFVGLLMPSIWFGYPLINDISTDLEDPPQFVKCAEIESNRGRDMSYPREFAAEQREGYPGLESAMLPVEPDLAIERVRSALESLPGTKVIGVDVDDGRIEAVSISRVFGFVDDVVVRIRPDGTGSRIDVRSKSRDGKGDLGANASRIESFLLALR